MILMDRKYSAEELADVESDVYEAISEDHDIPIDENGFQHGVFRVQITWEDDLVDE